MAPEEIPTEDVESYGPEVEDDDLEIDPEDETWQMEGGESA